MTILGLHHITLGCADAQTTIDFYTRILGLRFVKKTVNFDDPTTYHLYFGNQSGSPGSVVTFFEWPGVPHGHPGIGGTHHFALRVEDREGLLKWKRRLMDAGLAVEGPLDRQYFTSIYFSDPDGTILEIATDGPGFTVDEAPECLGEELREPPAQMIAHNRDTAAVEAETWPEPVPEIFPGMVLSDGMHHITAIAENIERTHDFYSGMLGLRLVKRTSNFDDPDSAHWYWGVEDGEPGSLITYFERDPAHETRVRIGTGQTHHFAFAVEDGVSQLAWRKKLVAAGLNVSPVMDRVYFKSIYTQDPDGHIVELATNGPGFTFDEDLGMLGQSLRLPPWLEGQRAAIESLLKPVEAPAWVDAEEA